MAVSSSRLRSFTRLPTIFENESDAALPPPRPEGLCSSLTDPLDVAQHAEHADSVLRCLADTRRVYQSKVIAWLLPAVRALSFTEHGGPVVCKALQVATGQERDVLVQELHGKVAELSMHKHGNQVLIKLVDMMPKSMIGFVFSEMTWHAVPAAQDRFAWQVLEGLIMQYGCIPEMAQIIDELVLQTKELSLDFYGNRVLQKIIEYGKPAYLEAILSHLLPDVLALASCRGFVAYVLRQALESGGEKVRLAITAALVKPAETHPPASLHPSLVDVACCKRGGALLVELADESDVDQSFADLQRHLLTVATRLRHSKHGLRVAMRYGLGSLALDEQKEDQELSDAVSMADLARAPIADKECASDDAQLDCNVISSGTSLKHLPAEMLDVSTIMALFVV